MAYIDDSKSKKLAEKLISFYKGEISDIYWEVDKNGYFTLLSGKDGPIYRKSYFFDLGKIQRHKQKLKERIDAFEKGEIEDIPIEEQELEIKDGNDIDIGELKIEKFSYTKAKDLYFYIQNIISYYNFCVQEYTDDVYTKDTGLLELYYSLFPFFFKKGKSDGALYLENIGDYGIKINNRANVTAKKGLQFFEEKQKIIEIKKQQVKGNNGEIIEKQIKGYKKDEEGNFVYEKDENGKEIVKVNRFLYDSFIVVLRPIYKIREIGQIQERVMSLENIEKLVINYIKTLDFIKQKSFERVLDHLGLDGVNIEEGKIFPTTNKNRDDLNVFFEGLNLGEGLMLISGPTGSGKTTLMMSLLNDYINKKEKTIVTIEDPIEYYLYSQKSIIIQREIGEIVSDYAKGLTDALRQRPSIIALGEIRNTETALQLANAIASGHLCVGTVHASSIAETVKRVDNLLEQNNVKIFFNYIINLRNVRINFSTDPNEPKQFATIYEHYLFDSSKDMSSNMNEITEMNEIFLSINKKLILLYLTKKITLDNCLYMTSDKNLLLKDLKEISSSSYFRDEFAEDNARVDSLTKGIN